MIFRFSRPFEDSETATNSIKKFLNSFNEELIKSPLCEFFQDIAESGYYMIRKSRSEIKNFNSICKVVKNHIEMNNIKQFANFDIEITHKFLHEPSLQLPAIQLYLKVFRLYNT